MLRICLFGTFEVERDGVAVLESEWSGLPPQQLLKLLALAPNHQLHKEQVMEYLWPERPPLAARNRLYHTLHMLRRVLTSGEEAGTSASVRLLLSHGMVRLEPLNQVWVDVLAFQQLLAAARHAADGLPQLLAATRLYRGPLLPADPYAEWALAPRESLQQLYLDGLNRLATLYQERNDYPAAIETWQSLVQAEPTHEAAHRQLMQAYMATNQRHEALRQYRQCVALLEAHIQMEPAPETQALYQLLIQPGGDPHLHVLIPVAQFPHSLPAPTTRLLGRETEVTAACALLQQAHVRLLTLTGVGGVGKTRLALEVAAAMQHTTSLRVVFVELGHLHDAALLEQTVAQQCGLEPGDDATLLARLLTELRTQPTLLLLDNCEHLVTVAMHVAALLTNVPSLKVLATSRALLHLSGEHELLVPPLALPAGPTPALADMQQSAAVALFVARTQALQPDFQLSEENALLVASICRRLDGLPLAIELAAARSLVLDLPTLLARLDQRFEVLTDGWHDLPPRHRTLRAVLEWSYHLLDAPTQRLLASLSVFVGTAPFPAIEALAAGVEAPATGVMRSLTTLVQNNLVQPQTINGERHFSMLETVREYAAACLNGQHMATEVCRVYAHYYVQLAETADPHFIQPDQQLWVARLEHQYENLRAALAWATAHAETELALRLCVALVRFWYRRSYLKEGRSWLGAALALPGHVAEALRARAQSGAGLLAWVQGDFEAAHSCFEESLARWRTIGDSLGLANTLNTMAGMLTDQGELKRAAQLMAECLTLRRELEDDWGVANALNNLGVLVQRQGNLAGSVGYFTEALATQRRLGDSQGIVIAVSNLANVAWLQGALAQAQALAEEGLPLARQIRDSTGVAELQSILARIFLQTGQLDLAHTCLAESLAHWQTVDEVKEFIDVLEGIAWLAALRGQVQPAAQLLGYISGQRETMGVYFTAASEAEHQTIVALSKVGIDGFTWQAAFAQGAAFTRAQVLALAATEVGDSTDAASEL